MEFQTRITMIPKNIQKALRNHPEGIRCCVAFPPTIKYREHWFQRGITGILGESRYPGHVYFLSDEKGLIHFKWKEWQGLHIPSLGIYRL
jgi:hypothetical protein